MAFLDENGLEIVWGKVKALVNAKKDHKVVSKTWSSLTVNANTSTVLSLALTAQTGYKPVGVMTIYSSGTGSTSITPYRWRFTNNSTLEMTVRSTTTKTTSYSVTCDILWEEV